FDRRLLLLLNEHIDFDGAWFGHSSLRPDGPLPHSAYLHNLRPGFMHDWEQVKLRDPLARLAETSSEKIVVASTSTVPLNDTMRRFCKAQGIAQVLFRRVRGRRESTRHAPVAVSPHASPLRRGRREPA
ncbi:hypothetical protein M3588_26520, partial [Cytobacillus sp. AMY 15.2]|nr:hypothetical protein [Cytobacillus sp. AMY 15.2]